MAKAKGTIKGIRVGRSGLFLTHLFFTDHSILFREASLHGATTAEAKACLHAVTVAEELGFQRLVVKGDPLTVVKKVRSLGEEISSIFVIIKEIKEKAQRFKELIFSFVGRLVNQVAHAMAKEGKQWSLLRVWIEEAPLRVEVEAERNRRNLI
ncbi:hypothetical protein CXB51_034252 [Gossypium anomalum]|uniref:RNase H type-1 domain-containing protein n=1 Tax=Gossypium anomalum TaxID=47600 RepID=A0A8J6CIN0_9ROSI|nr:hypothetical protein CXB51_034252 [Gossypium anomalum]